MPPRRSNSSSHSKNQGKESMEWGVRRKELALALLMLMMASSLPDSAECYSFQFPLTDFNLGEKFYGVISGVKRWFQKAERWWVSLGRQLRKATFRSRRQFEKWYSWLKRAAAAPFTTRNAYVRCAKASWNECLKRNKGLALASGLWCTWIVYVECDMAFYIDKRRDWTRLDPFYNEGRGVPPERLYHHRRKDHPYGI